MAHQFEVSPTSIAPRGKEFSFLKSARNWGGILEEIKQASARAKSEMDGAIHSIRRKYLSEFHRITGRNVISYYSGFLSKPDIDSSINDEDKNGFMMTVHGLSRPIGLDLILHTPGGGMAATQSIVDYLYKMFPLAGTRGADIRVFVPQIAMSAGTMIACSSREIWMAKHSNLGPIDPQRRGIACNAVRKEFQRALRDVKKDRDFLDIWTPILRQYSPTFLGECDNALRWAKDFVGQQLACNMFAGQRDAKKRAAKIVDHLSKYKPNRTHEIHVHREECQKIGLVIKEIEADQNIQDAILPVHHCYMHTLMNTNIFKIIENHNGVGMIKAVAPGGA
jgi:ClpP class serine protease